MKTAITDRFYNQLVSWAFIVMMLAAPAAYAQNTNSKAFEAIPPPLRQRLVERLALYVEYQRSRQYDKLYDLLSWSTIQRVYRGQSKEEFVRAIKKETRKAPAPNFSNSRLLPHRK